MPSISQNLQPFICNGDVSKILEWDKNSKQTKQKFFGSTGGNFSFSSEYLFCCKKNPHVLEATCCEVVHSLGFLDCRYLQELNHLRYISTVPSLNFNGYIECDWPHKYGNVIDVSKDYSAISIEVHLLNRAINLLRHKGCKFCWQHGCTKLKSGNGVTALWWQFWFPWKESELIISVYRCHTSISYCAYCFLWCIWVQVYFYAITVS